MSRARVGLVLLLALAVAQAADAAPKRRDEASSESDTQARRLYEDGTRAFNLGEFPNAITLYRQAYKLRPEPVLLYNIAQAYRLTGDSVNALFFYKSFLRAAPATPNKREVEERIRKLEATVAEQKDAPNSAVELGSLPAPVAERPAETPTAAVETPPPAEKPETSTSAATASSLPEPTPSPSSPVATTVIESKPAAKPLHKQWWLWTVVGVAAVGVGLGIGLGIGLQNRAPSAHFGTREAF